MVRCLRIALYYLFCVCWKIRSYIMTQVEDNFPVVMERGLETRDFRVDKETSREAAHWRAQLGSRVET